VSRATRITVLCAALLGLFMAGCNNRQIAVPESSPDYRGAVLFQERCSGCHTLTPAASAGSKPANQVASNDRTNGPNLDQRVETVDDVLFAIRNGGFSGAIMPANIVVGQEAQDVAEFVAKYAGTERPEELGGDEAATSTPTPTSTEAEPVDEGTEDQADDSADEGSGRQAADEQQTAPE
jgi:mono/diheme cytochrome c family protein